MSARAGFRLFHATRTARTAFQRPFQRNQRRTQATATDAAAAQGTFAKIWNSPVGPKTVHFWAPVMKWALVLTGISDFARPAESLSLTQNVALMATGAIWTRWCMIIKPKNYLLAMVNFFLFCVGGTQVGRILQYKRSDEGRAAVGEVRSAAQKEKEAAQGIVKDAQVAVKRAVGS